MNTDPPYLVNYTGLCRPQTKGVKSGGKDWSHVYHEVDIKNAQEFFSGFLNEALKILNKKSLIYIWHAHKRYPLLEEVCKASGVLPHQQIVWVKPAAITTFSFFAWKHENCLLCWRKGERPKPIGKLKNVGSVWYIEYIGSDGENVQEPIIDVWEKDWEGKKRAPSTKMGHPTCKPVGVFTLPIRLTTKPGDICYEPFCGSGSQLIAAEMTGRRCYAMEIEPVFVDQSVRRWEEFTGKKAELKKKKVEF